MKLCGSVNWCKIGRLVVVINLLLVSSIAWSQNIPPVLNTGIPNQHTEVSSSFSYTFPNTAFKDANGDVLKYTVKSSPAGASINGRTITVNSGAEGSIEVTVTADDQNGGKASTTFNIEVDPSGGTYAAFTMNTNMGCGYLSVQFNNKSSMNLTGWDWDLGNGNHSPYPTPSATYTEPGSYVVTLTAKDDAGQTYSYTDVVNVYENPAPSIDQSSIKNDCEPYFVTLTSNGASGVYYHWYCEELEPRDRYTTNGSISLSELPNKKYNVELRVTDANGCSGIAPYQPLFEVYDKPTASFTYDKTDDCKASWTNFTNTSTVEGGTITGHSWKINGSQVGTDKDLSYNFTSADTYIVSLTETSGNNCVSDAFTDTVVFNANNHADFSFSPAQACKGTAITFSPNVSAGISGYDWVFEGSHVSAINPSWNFTAAGQNPSQLNASFNDGCVINVTQQIPIDSIISDFSYTITGVCQNGFTLDLSNNSYSMIDSAITSVKWSRDITGDGNYQQINPPLTGLNAGTYHIKLDVSDATGCSSSVIKDITLSNSSLSFSIDGATSGCADTEAINFFPIFQSGYDSITSYSWDFGDGTSTEANPTHTFGNGNFTVSLSVTTKNNCPYSYTKNNAVQFADPPVIDSVRFTQSDSCMSTSVTFNTYFTSGTDHIEYTSSENPTQTDDFEVGGTSYPYSRTFKNFGNFNLTAVAIDNGCPSSAYTATGIQVNGPKASFSTANSFCNVLDVHFSNSTTTNGAVPTYSWNFGDENTSTATSPTHHYNEAGDYTVSLTATDTVSGCSDTYSQTIKIFTFDNSVNDIISASTSSGCAPLDVSFTADISSNISANYSGYNLEWDFDANNSIDSVSSFTNIDHSYSKSGIYTARLHVTGNGCNFITDYSPITVLGPIVDFTYSSPACSGSPVAFTNKSTQPAGGTANDFEWNFDGTIYSAPSPGNATYTFHDDDAKTVSLTITDSNGCSDTLSKTFNIEPFSAGFTASDTTVCNGDAVTFTNTSEGSNLTYRWDFDNDGTFDLITTNSGNVSYTYSLAGDFTPSLEVATSNGCTKTITQSIHVVNASADFSAAATEIGCAPADASFKPVAEDADVESYLWDYGDGITSEEREATHRYYTPGTYTVSLTITFTSGCDSTATKIITVDGAKGELNYSGLPACAPNEVVFTLTEMWSTESILWDFGNGIVKTDTVPSGTTTYSTTYTYTGAGYTKPSVLLTSTECAKSYAYEKNSTDLINDPVNIYTSVPPTAAFSTNYDDICEGIPINFSDISGVNDALYPASRWEWSFGDGVSDTLHQNPNHAYINTGGRYYPQLIISNALGCSDTATLINGIYIHNRNEIQANIDVPANDNELVCPGSPVNFSGSATTLNEPVISWKWNFGDGNSAAIYNPDHTFSKILRGQPIEIMLVATDEKLCSDSTFRTVAINNLQADLGYSPQPVHRGDFVDFSDETKTSTGDSVNSWEWTFENGLPGTYFLQKPFPVYYEAIQTNYVQLTVTSQMGCTDTVLDSIRIWNNPPELESFDIKTLINTPFKFNVDVFKDHFTDKDTIVGQQMQGIQIVSVPSNGKLYFGSTEVSAGKEISLSDIVNLYYFSSTEGSDAFDWNATDGTDYADGAATVNIQVDSIPPAPTLSDIVFDIREDSVLTFSLTTFRDYFTNRLMFDGFGLDILRVVTIPTSAQGRLTYNSSDVNTDDEFSETQIEEGSFTVTPVTGYDGEIIFYWNGFDSLKWGEAPARVIINYINAVPDVTDIERINLKQDEVQTITKEEIRNHYSDSDKNDSPETFYLEIPSGLDGTFKINGTVAAPGTNTLSFGDLVSVTFTPTTGYEGEIDVEWGISDGQDTSYANIRFTYINVPPVANDFSVSGTEDKIFKFKTEFFSDESNNRLPFEDEDQNDKLAEIEILTLPENGYLTFKRDDNKIDTLNEPITLTADQINLLLWFVPNKDWFGTTSFTYKVSDGTDWSIDPATVWITITPVNDAPVAENDFYPILEDEKLDSVNVLDNDTDVDDIGDSLRVSIADEGSAGEHGTITLDTHGNLTYQPKLNFNGAVSFTYTVCDTSNACANATVTIDVAPVNDPPIAKNDTITIFDDTKFYSSVDTTNLLYNDRDPEGDSIYIARVEETNPGDTIMGNSGKIIVYSSGDYTYIPDSSKVVVLDENEMFIDSFQYVAADYPEGLVSTARLLIRIKGLNTPPVAKNDTVHVFENSILDYNPAKTLLTNDSDPEDNPLTIDSINGDITGLIDGPSGILKWLPDGQFHYQQGKNNDLFDSLSEGTNQHIEFIYTLSDGKIKRNAKLTIIIDGKNDKPVAKNDENNLLESDDSISSDSTTKLLSNDSDIDRGDSIHVSKINSDTKGKYGTLVWYGDGSYTYYINHDATDSLFEEEPATDQFPYQIDDEYGGYASSYLTITITGTDDIPNAVNDTLRVNEDDFSGSLTAGTDGLLDSDTDVDGDSLKVTKINDSYQHTLITRFGTINWDSLGNIDFIINSSVVDSLKLDEIASDSVRYVAEDPSGGANTAQLFIIIKGENDNPSAMNDRATISEDTLSFSGSVIDSTSLLSNDSDIEGDSIFAMLVNDSPEPLIKGNYGELQWDPTGSYTYFTYREITDTLAQGEIVNDVFVYVLSDIHGGTDTASFTVEIVGVNDAPVAFSNRYLTFDIAPVLVAETDTNDILDNDTDVDSYYKKLTEVNDSTISTTKGNHGILSWNNDGGFEYKPDSAFAVSLRPLIQVTDTFTYRMEDEYQAADTSLLHFIIEGINNAPIARNDTLYVNEDDLSRQLLPLPGLLAPENVEDPDRDTLKILTMAGSENDSIAGKYGYIKWDGIGKVIYTTNQKIIHQLGFEQVVTESFSYTIVDEGGLTARANLIVKIIGENDPVTAIDDTLRMDEDSFGKKNVVSNDKDVDNNEKGNFDYSSLTVVADFGPYHGTASRNSVTGEIYYHPDKDFYGRDSLKYSISDKGEPVFSDSAWLYIDVRSVNDPPVATHLVLETPMNTPVEFEYLKQLTDIDDGIDPDWVGLPNNNLVKKEVNFIVYTPETDFTGIDEFTYSMKDYSGEAAYVIVTVIVGDTLSDFMAQNDYISTWEDTPANIFILENDIFGDETPDPRSVEIKVFPKNGVSVYDWTNQFIQYQPKKDFYGIDSLEYIVSSGPGNWSSAKVYIAVTPVNDPFIANDDIAETTIDVSVSIPVLANDSDPDNRVDSLSVATQPQNGKVNKINPKVIHYIPDVGFVGIDSFTYRICDSNIESTECDEAKVTINVKAENAGFTALNDTCSTKENVPCRVDPLANDLNTNKELIVDSTTLSILGGPLYGSETINTDYTVTYTPEENYFGPDWMQYIVSDTAGNWDMAEINIWVNEVNVAPVAVNDTAIVTKNEFKRLFVLENDYDIDGTLKWSTLDTVSGKGPRIGAVEFDRNTGTVLYKPSVNEGTDRFTYTVCDNEGLCDEATVDITVELDTTIYIYRTTFEDTPDTLDLVSKLAEYNMEFNITDFHRELEPTLGTYTFINNNNELVYIPEPDSNGTDAFRLSVCSADGICAYLRIFVKIIPVNDAPVAMNDTIHWLNTFDDKFITFDSLLVNDYDVDGDPLFMTDSVIQTGYDELRVIFNADSTILISADTIYWCEAWFTYEIKDPDGLSDTAKVTIMPKLEGINAKNDLESVDENSLNNLIDVLVNDLFVDNQRCTIDTIIIITQPKHGTAIGTYDNFVDYTPTRHYFGADSLLYQIIDIWGQTSTAWIYINVLEKNTPPVAVDDIPVEAFGTVMNIAVLNNDYDPDALDLPGSPGDPNAFIVPEKTHLAIGSYPLYGSVVFDNTTFNFIYTPDVTSCESDSFHYTIYDNEGDSATATVTIGFSEAPLFAVPDIKKTYPGVEVEVEPLLNDSGYYVPDWTTHTIPQSIHGTVNWNSQNVVTYTPDNDFIGRDSILYALVSPCGNEKGTYIVFIVEELRVPEIITPNNDGKNDVLIIEGIEYFPDNLFQIYNRYGHIVYQKKGYMNEWGGYSNKGSLGGDKSLPAGTYYYTLIYNEGRNRQAGFIYIFL